MLLSAGCQHESSKSLLGPIEHLATRTYFNITYCSIYHTNGDKVLMCIISSPMQARRYGEASWLNNILFIFFPKDLAAARKYELLLAAENQYAARRKKHTKKHTFICRLNFTNYKNLKIPRTALSLQHTHY